MELELSQKQGLTLAMQTSMRVLQLNNLQLRNYIGDVMTSNAVVELEYPEIDYRPGPFDGAGQFERVKKQNDGEDVSKEQLMADKAESSSVLHDLFLQSAVMKPSATQQRIMNFLIQSLDENGFLSESAESAAHALHVPVDAVKTCIARLQSMEPAGVGAADLRDCLRLQLLRIAPQDTIAQQIVSSYLEQMAKQQYSAIAKALHVPKNEVIASCERIRTLNPKPLNGLGGEVMTQYILPDFYILEDNGQLRCVMNDYYLPKIKIDPSYWDAIRNKTISPADSEYIRKNYKQANDLLQFLSYRESTLQRVVEYIMTVQREFFLYGPGHRAAMGNREIAQALSLHESTISRAVNGKFFECKWGVFPLKSLFVHSAHYEQGEPGDTSGGVDHILNRLKALIASETPGAAFSDQHLVDLLKAEGISIARRTVAKYRQSLGIPTASQRNARQG